MESLPPEEQERARERFFSAGHCETNRNWCSISAEEREKIAGSYRMTTEHPRLDDSDAKLWCGKRTRRDPKTPPRTFPTTQIYRAITYFIAWRPAPRMVNAHDPALVVDTIADHVPSDLAVTL